MKEEERFIQIKNPKTKYYILIDRHIGQVIGFSNPNRPFHRIKIVSYKKEMRRENDSK